MSSPPPPSLRQAAQKFYDMEIWGKSRAYVIEQLELFIQQQRVDAQAAVWREAQRELETPLEGGGKHISDFAAWDYFESQAQACEAYLGEQKKEIKE